jgi:hypothetical protein
LITLGAARRVGLAVGMALLLSACAADKMPDDVAVTSLDFDLLNWQPDEQLSFRDDVQPVLDQRCVVCHGCWDAPCQLKLSSHEGVARGANPDKVYDGARVKAVQPTRLFIDANGKDEWRSLGFSPVLAESATTPEEYLERSVLYRMLRLKELFPQRRRGRLPPSFDLSLDRKQVCTDIDGFDAYSREHPRWGMPYAMPNLSDDEYATLVQWVAQGAKSSPAEPPSAAAAAAIGEWEAFFNGQSNKQRLVSRYLYEHLFLAHVYFAGADQREFYRLVRSRKPPGEAIDEIATVLPFDDPGTSDFYYRLRRYRASIVAKDHLPYELSPARMERFRELFLDPDYTVDELPGYDPKIASNPFRTFAALPPDSRYRFMLDEARFFINGFMKGPVCRGQVALNVIDDHFWVFFFDPDQDLFTSQPEFLDAMSGYLQLPAERGAETLNVLAVFTDYSKKQKAYMAAKEKRSLQMHAADMDTALKYIWDGDGRNRNAALTVFRHFDSASVSFGTVGDYPDTAWIIDYPLFERIHYLLVAGFDVYGNVGHQLNTRLYMDFLRMEGEDHFLAFLPVAVREAIRDEWYEGPRSKRREMLAGGEAWLTTESVVGYRTDDPQRELYQYISARLGLLAGPPDLLNRCVGDGCIDSGLPASRTAVYRNLKRLAQLRGERLHPVPDVTFLRVRMGGEEPDLVFSIVRNKGYRNLNSIFADEDQRNIADDTLTIVEGFVGEYPNFFLAVDAADIEAFAEQFEAAETVADYERFVQRYGIRRSNPSFWAEADWFYERFSREQPVEYGILDLNRYRNL